MRPGLRIADRVNDVIFRLLERAGSEQAGRQSKHPCSTGRNRARTMFSARRARPIQESCP